MSDQRWTIVWSDRGREKRKPNCYVNLLIGHQFFLVLCQGCQSAAFFIVLYHWPFDCSSWRRWIALVFGLKAFELTLYPIYAILYVIAKRFGLNRQLTAVMFPTKTFRPPVQDIHWNAFLEETGSRSNIISIDKII